MAIFKKCYVDGEYGQIHVRLSEPSQPNHVKPPLVCSHMFPRSSRNLEAFVKAADDSRLVVAPDSPGYGESSRPPKPIKAADYARSVWQVIDGLGLLKEFSKVDLFGIHAGSKLATEVARQRPNDVNKIALCSAAVLTQQEVDEIKKAFVPIPLDAKGSRISVFWKILVDYQGPGQSYESLVDGLADMLRAGEAYEWGQHAVFDFNADFPEVLASLPHPIALMNPNDDLHLMTPRTEAYLNNGKLFSFPQWELGFMETKPSEVFQAVIESLETV